MARRILRSQAKAPRLTKKQTAILRQFSKNAKELASRLRTEARRLKSEAISKERATLRPGKKGTLTKKTMLNTWTEETTKQRARMEVAYIKSGKHKGMFRDKRTNKIVTQATVNRRAAMYRYHSQVQHIHKILGGSYAQARKGYKAFLIAGVLKATEFEYD